MREALIQAGRQDLIGSGCDCLIPAQPPKEAIEARRRRANDTAGEYHYHTVANPAKGEPAGERGLLNMGYLPAGTEVAEAAEKGEAIGFRRTSMRFAEHMAKLSDEQRLHFYEVLAHNLTVSIRGIWSDEQLDNAEKVDQMKWVNEILHRVTAKVYALRLETHEWTEEAFERLILESVGAHPGITHEVGWAVRFSYRAITGEEM